MRCVHFRTVLERVQHNVIGRGTYDVFPMGNVTCHHMIEASYHAATHVRHTRAGTGTVGKQARAELLDVISRLNAEMPGRAVFRGDRSDAPYKLSLNEDSDWICGA